VKIAFIGTHGVGKTTLCYDLAAALKRQGVHVDMVKEVARLSPLPINRQTSLDAQTWILTTQIAEEIRSCAHHQVVVCDRSRPRQLRVHGARLRPAAGVRAAVVHWMKTLRPPLQGPDRGRRLRGRRARHRRVLHARESTSWWTRCSPRRRSPRTSCRRAAATAGSRW
jgi:hypothetical protein